MRAYGNVRAGGPMGGRGIDIPTEPRPTGRTVVTDLERAHTPTWRIPTVETVRPPTPKAPAVTTAPAPARPDWVTELTQLLIDTEAHPDPAVTTARKVLANAAVALRKTYRATQTPTTTPARAQPTTALRTAGVPTRPATARLNTGAHTAQAMGDALRQAGITTTQLRAWARAEGLIVPARGRLPMGVLNAYLASHDNTNRRTA